ncbi:serine/threonine-protein kinase [Nocardia sp. NPDC051833]|uniref:WD40 repeat domain-containing serine/threonine protein kinase n=1 Tax=Nocardia sp. NPDC051833 TaxID=3155674 RepID=UPI00342AFE9B
MPLAAGAVFAGYTIERMLGAGGMGVVYLARHPRLDRRVALKVLNDSFAADPHARAAFDREAAVAAGLDHPNIVAVHDRSAPDDAALWLAIRYVDGGDVAAVIDAAPSGIAVDRAVRLLTDAAHALDFAHRNGVLHRDVKPANLLVENDPRHGERALLTDFGIARSLDGTQTRSGVSATLAYVAPERFSAEPTDHRADIYSLGCTLYELLTGKKPFDGRDDYALIGAHLNEQPTPPRDRRGDLPAGLDAVLTTALAKRPADRFPTCLAFADAVARAVAPAAPTVVRGEARPTPRPPARTARRGTASTARPVATTRTAPIVVARPRPGLSAPVNAVAFSPDSAVLATTADGPDGDGHLQLSDARTGAPIGALLRDTDIPIQALAFSPQGTLLAAGGDGVQLWDPRAGHVVQRPVLHRPDLVTALAFGPEGTVLAIGTCRGRVELWNTRTASPIGPPITGRITEVNSVAFGPDAALLAIGGTSPVWKRRPVQVWRPAIGEPDSRALPGLPSKVTSVAFSPDGALLAVGGGDGTVCLLHLDPSARAIQQTWIHSHTDTVQSVAFSPDGALLAVGGDDALVRLWDVRTAQPYRAPLLCPADTLAFSPDGTLLATGGAGPTHLWQVGNLPD